MSVSVPLELTSGAHLRGRPLTEQPHAISQYERDDPHDDLVNSTSASTCRATSAPKMLTARPSASYSRRVPVQTPGRRPPPPSRRTRAAPDGASGREQVPTKLRRRFQRQRRPHRRSQPRLSRGRPPRRRSNARPRLRARSRCRTRLPQARTCRARAGDEAVEGHRHVHENHAALAAGRRRFIGQFRRCDGSVGPADAASRGRRRLSRRLGLSIAGAVFPMHVSVRP